MQPIIVKTPTHPPEATYPCCIPALGGLGGIAPRRSIDNYTRAGEKHPGAASRSPGAYYPCGYFMNPVSLRYCLPAVISYWISR